jgi:hypothetical protein
MLASALFWRYAFSPTGHLVNQVSAFGQLHVMQKAFLQGHSCDFGDTFICKY